MPKETSIPVSKKTLKFVQEYRDEFQLSSLEEAIQDSIRWSKLWIAIDFQQRRNLQERINDLEFKIEQIESDRERDLLVIRDTWKRFVALGILVNQKLKGEKNDDRK